MNRFSLRMASLDDAAEILSIYSPYVENSVASFETEAPGLEEFKLRMAGIMTRYPYLVCETEKGIAGFAYAHRHMERAAYQWNGELSVYMKPEFTARGCGRALYRALIIIAAEQKLYNLYGGVTLPNPASVGLHESLGFRRLGVFKRTGYKFGRWHDVAWFEKRLAEPAGTPTPPLTVRELEAGRLAAVLAECSPVDPSQAGE